MPGEALDGDTEGRSRDEEESEESEEQVDMTRKKDNSSEVESSSRDEEESEESEEQGNTARRKNTNNKVEARDDSTLKNGVRCEMVEWEEGKEAKEDEDDDDDDDDEGEDSWFAQVQKRRIEEEKDFAWIRAIDKEPYLKVMGPLYLLLEVRSGVPLEVQQVRLAVSHLQRLWPWWGISIRHRGQARTPWLCVAPTQRLTLQVVGSDEDDEEAELWDVVDQQQWRHTEVAEGVLSSVTLITHPSLSAAAAAVAAAPHAHRNEAMTPTTGAEDAAAAPTMLSTSTQGQAVAKPVPDLPHRVYLLLGVPRPFVDHTTAEAICHALVQLLDDVLASRILEEYQPTQDSRNQAKDVAEGGSLGLHSWLAERLQTVVEEKTEGDESNAEAEAGRGQAEENEHNSPGYVQRTFDGITSCNFINRCKAERVSYVNGFATCVSTAAAAFLKATMAGEQAGPEQQVVTRQRVCEHLHWPGPPLDWHDRDPEEEPPPEPSSRPPGVTITAPSGNDASLFWETARHVSRQRWGASASGRREDAMHILHGLGGEDSEDDVPPQRYPTVSLCLCDIQRDEAGAASVQRAGAVTGVGPHRLSPLRHFLMTHTVNLHLEEASQVLSFSLHHSTLFLSPATGRKFADEIEAALRSSLQCR